MTKRIIIFFSEKLIKMCLEGEYMAKQGMRRHEAAEHHDTEAHKFDKNAVRPVPEIKGPAKAGKKRAGPL